MSKVNDGYDFQFIVEESSKAGVLYKVTMKMGELESVFEDDGCLQDILGGYAGLIQELSIRDNCYVDPTTPVSYTHLTLPTKYNSCRSRWSPYH